jgi:hypothetical protein
VAPLEDTERAPECPFVEAPMDDPMQEGDGMGSPATPPASREVDFASGNMACERERLNSLAPRGGSLIPPDSSALDPAPPDVDAASRNLVPNKTGLVPLDSSAFAPASPDVEAAPGASSREGVTTAEADGKVMADWMESAADGRLAMEAEGQISEMAGNSTMTAAAMASFPSNPLAEKDVKPVLPRGPPSLFPCVSSIIIDSYQHHTQTQKLC